MRFALYSVTTAASNFVSKVSNTLTSITASKPIAAGGSQNELQTNLDALIARSPSDEFIFHVPKDSHLSPYWASDEVLSQFPPTKILVRVVGQRDCTGHKSKREKTLCHLYPSHCRPSCSIPVWMIV